MCVIELAVQELKSVEVVICLRCDGSLRRFMANSFRKRAMILYRQVFLRDS